MHQDEEVVFISGISAILCAPQATHVLCTVLLHGVSNSYKVT